jgi:hypothetical protein
VPTAQIVLIGSMPKMEVVVRIVPDWHRAMIATLKPLLPNFRAMRQPPPEPPPTITDFTGHR